MRLVSHEDDGVLKPGVLFGATVFDVAKLISASGDSNGRSYGSQRELLETHGSDLPALAATLQAAAREAGDARVGDLGDVRLGPPVPDPAKVLCVGLNYGDHVAET